MKISIFGSGYVGLVTAACFAEAGHKVLCIDINREIVENLSRGNIHFYEPDLTNILDSALKKQNISFSTDQELGFEFSDALFICIGTPQNQDGSSNMSFINSLIDEFGKNKNATKHIFMKSTVPVGTCNLFQERLNQNNPNFTVSSNPEFLREGNAVHDFFNPDRIIIGTNSDNVKKISSKIYKKLNLEKKLMFMNPASSELTKYASNCFLATKISFINEVSNFAKLSGAEIHDVQLGVGSDPRIGDAFLNSGLGFGGSCFPKDMQSFVHQSKSLGLKSRIISSALKTNAEQLENFVEIIKLSSDKDHANQSITIWGTSFKPDTSDIRESRGIEVITRLSNFYREIKIYDPLAGENTKHELLKRGISNFNIYSTKYESIKDSFGLIIAVEDKAYLNSDLTTIHSLLKKSVIYDGRKLFSKHICESVGIQYISL